MRIDAARRRLDKRNKLRTHRGQTGTERNRQLLDRITTLRQSLRLHRLWFTFRKQWLKTSHTFSIDSAMVNEVVVVRVGTRFA